MQPTWNFKVGQCLCVMSVCCCLCMQRVVWAVPAPSAGVHKDLKPEASLLGSNQSEWLRSLAASFFACSMSLGKQERGLLEMATPDWSLELTECLYPSQLAGAGVLSLTQSASHLLLRRVSHRPSPPCPPLVPLPYLFATPCCSSLPLQHLQQLPTDRALLRKSCCISSFSREM